MLGSLVRIASMTVCIFPVALESIMRSPNVPPALKPVRDTIGLFVALPIVLAGDEYLLPTFFKAHAARG